MLRLAAVVLACLVLLTILAIVATVFIGLHRMSEYSAMYATVRTPRAKISEIYQLLQTGDVILFVATTSSPSNCFLTQTFHSHAGVLVREGDLVYISETQPGLELMPDPRAPAEDLRMSRGAVLTPLLTRLKYYTGDYYVLRLSRALPREREEALKREAERLHRDHYPYPSLSQIILGLSGWNPKARHCFQHAAHLLDIAGLTPAELSTPLAEAGFINVCRIMCELDQHCLPAGYYYKPPVQVLYDVGTIAEL